MMTTRNPQQSTKSNGVNKKDNGVMIVTSQPKVRDWLYDFFTTKFQGEYYIVGDAPTRETAIRMAGERKPKLIIFLEQTAGMVSLSETVYRLRIEGARIIFISTQRNIGDLVLESLVQCGVYDIVLNTAIDINELEFQIRNPKEFKDVAVFMRQPQVPDEGIGERNFKIPDLNLLRRMSDRLDTDYLVDPMERAVEGTRANINYQVNNEHLVEGFFQNNGAGDRVPQFNNQARPQPQKSPVPQPPKTSNFGDLEDIDF